MFLLKMGKEVSAENPRLNIPLKKSSPHFRKSI
jgi:hypothetical protein